MDAWLRGCAGAPLVATREYRFERGTTPAGAARLGIPWQQRGSWDDHGAASRAEQAVFVERLIASLGATARGGEPGEWIFAEPAQLDRVWAALAAALVEPATRAPEGRGQLSVPRAAARAAANELTRRFVALAATVVGVPAGSFVCKESRIEHGDYDQCTRHELWCSGEVQVRVEGEGITSGHGVHGEVTSLRLAAPGLEGRDAIVHARIDMRSGGEVSVTVRGVLDAQALADGFVAPG